MYRTLNKKWKTKPPCACVCMVLQFEGIPVHPHVGRFWEVIEKYKVTKFYTAPTAIRLLMKYGREPLQKYVDTSSAAAQLNK